jgi:hypothetical protein
MEPWKGGKEDVEVWWVDLEGERTERTILATVFLLINICEYPPLSTSNFIVGINV